MHRLVAKAFIPNHNPKEQTQCHHKNDCKFDYRIENLELVTSKKNSIGYPEHRRVSRQITYQVHKLMKYA